MPVRQAVVAFISQSNDAPGSAPDSTSGDRTVSAYALPTEALGGQTLAGYLAEHYGDRVARR